ncbi:MAG: MliC family protein [Jhaorihella sp.]
MTRIGIIALAMFVGAEMATAQVGLSIPLGTGATSSLNSKIYTCDAGEPFSVQYVNSGANALAILPVGGEARVFVNVVSGSGAKYASGSHVWWTKGEEATLEDEMETGSRMTCKVTDALPSD